MIEGHGGWRVMSVQCSDFGLHWSLTLYVSPFVLFVAGVIGPSTRHESRAAGVIIVPPCLIYFIGWMIWKIEKMEWTFVYLTFYPRILFTIKIARVWKKEKEVALWLWVTSMEMRRIWFWFYLILVELWICPAVMCPIWSMNMNISD